MRIRQLDLLRYGHFTNASISLPHGVPDFQMLLGENEAGKSTAMNGVEDLLFGIPANSPRNFLHEYNAMRVGAVLERAATRSSCAAGKATRIRCSAKMRRPFRPVKARLRRFSQAPTAAFTRG